MNWNEFKKIVDKQLTEEQKKYEMDYIDLHWLDFDRLEVYINEDTKDIAIH